MTNLAGWEPVIGLEIHAQLRTDTKIFCGCSTRYGAPPNSQVCPVCLGHPGVLPVLNRRVADMGLRVALSIGATIDRASVFARKNYFYHDLPKGYQISQFDRPLCTGGSLAFMLEQEGAAERREVRFHRIHVEEDAGKSLHPDRGEEPVTRVDLNRCGTPLIEIVTEPDIRSAEEAYAFLTRLKQLLVFLEVNDGNMEEGSLRCDANVSVRRVGESAFGTKTEIKNLNSFKNVERGIRYEIERQVERLLGGERVVQETRQWDAGRGVTVLMRSKEEAHDYRYFPEPDLLPLILTDADIERVRAELPELPEALERRLESTWGIPAYDARVLAATRPMAAWFERAAAASGDGKLTSNWVMTEVLRLLKEGDGDPSALPFAPEDLGRMVKLISAGTISGKIGKIVMEEMAAGGGTPEAIIAAKGLVQINDDSAIDGLIEEALAAHPGPVAEYLAGKEATFQFLIGQVMKVSKGRANPGALRERLKAALEKRKANAQ
jgi:aspartyl-tRNA(Asn)/glutamyl-tRNA(Gln) amidotransferase subunit B